MNFQNHLMGFAGDLIENIDYSVNKSASNTTTSNSSNLTPMQQLLDNKFFVFNLITTSVAMVTHLVVFYGIFQVFFKQSNLL